jgi:RNA polymerase sigma-70 factor (ECF subfamily)
MVITEDCVEPSAAPELFARARVGEASAFCSLTEPLQTRLLRQAAALSGDLSLAEDLVSETLVEAWKSFARYNESCRLSTWLYAILLHRWQKSLRHARSRPISFAGLSRIEADELHSQQENIPSQEASPAETAARTETFLQLRQCVERLPEKHRHVILLRFFEDASLPDIAVVLNCSVGTVKSRLHHALEKLREMKLNLPDLKGDEQI